MSDKIQPKVVVGQELFITNYSPTDAKGRYFTVDKVGRKYFSVEGLRRRRFLVADNTDASTAALTGSNRAVIHQSEEEYNMLVKSSRLRNAIYRSVRNNSLAALDLEQLKSIASTLEIDVNDF